jgi:site-specific recombinase XerD
MYRSSEKHTAGGRVSLKRGFAEESISARISSIKTFSYKYIYRRLELTKWDLLIKVERFDAPVRTKPGLTHEELEQVLTCYDDSDEYIAIRDTAIMLVFASSALRFSAVLRLKLAEVDRWSGRITTIDKGNKERRVKIGERACKALRRYWRIRRAFDGVEELFTTQEGRAFTYQGGQSVFRRLKTASGLRWMHSHRFRHTWAQGAIRKGAELGLVQEAMGWNSDRMAKRYQGWVRQERAAEAMPALAPV